MINIEIRGTSNHNKGAEMMLITIIQELSANSRKFIYQPTSFEDGYEFYSTLNLYPKAHISFKGFDLSFLFKLLPKLIKKRYGLHCDSDIQIVLDSSGFSYSDQWGIKPAIKLLNKLKIWEKNKVYVILMPQAFGPFNNQKLKKVMIKIIKKVQEIYVRDEASYQYLCGVNHLYKNKFKKYPDFTCLLKGKVPNYFNKNLYEICIVPNYRICDKTDLSLLYISTIINLIKIIREYDLKPFFLIHGDDSDKELSAIINNKISQRLEIITESNPIYLKGIISSSKAIIGSRYHSLVTGLNSAVPTFGIGWSHKYTELFKSNNFNQGNLSLPISEKKLRNIVSKIANLNERNKITKDLSISSQKQKKLSKELFKKLENQIHQIEKNLENSKIQDN